MKRNKPLSRGQKRAMLTKLTQGNATPIPIRQLKQAQDTPFVYLLDACQTFPEERSVIDQRADDWITDIVLTSSYADGRPNRVETMPAMRRVDFEAWHRGLREGGFAVVSMLITRVTP